MTSPTHMTHGQFSPALPLRPTQTPEPRMPQTDMHNTWDPALTARNTRRRVRSAGFTIVEVVVAMGVVLILLYIISLLFSQVSKASDMILVNYAVSSYNTALGAQLRDDVRRINKDGFLVIRNHAFQDPATGQWTNIDQILFLTSGEVNSQMYGLQWVQPNGTVAGAPATGESDTGLRRSFSATDARVWYGHVNPASAMTYAANDPLAAFGTVDSRLWALGRQQLLLAGKYVSLDGAANAPSDDLWVNKTTATSVVTSNYFGGANRNLNPFVDGRTDIIADPVTATPDAVRSAILNGDIDPTTAGTQAPRFLNSAAPWTQPWYGGPPTWAGLDQYQRMEGACFRPYGQRKLPMTNALSADFLQTQLIIAPYCSNFKVEFAGDFTNSVAGSYNAGTPLSSTLTTSRDGVVDVLKTVGGTTGGPNGNTNPTNFTAPTYEPAPYTIYWYGGYDSTTGNRNVVLPAAGATNYGNGSGTRALNARLANMTTVLASGNADNNLYTAVFGYDRSTTPWPRLLRVTANLQDDKGRLRQNYLNNKTTPGAVDGKQFQFVIEVPQ
jgi:hypothetical protein